MAYKSAKAEKGPSYKELMAELRRSGPGRLYMFWGPEDYLTERFVSELRLACLAEGAADFDGKRLDGPQIDPEALEEALNAMPFFGERTFVELKGVDINRCTDERFQRLFSDIPDWCTVAITLPAGMEPDGRRSLTKLIRKLGCAVSFGAQPEAALYAWLRQHFAARGKTIGQREMSHLLFISGTLMTRLVPEIDKVCAYARGEAVTIADIEAVAHHIPEARVFEMTDALSAGDTDRAAALLAELLAGGEEPIMICAVVGSQYRGLYAARLAMDMDLGAAYVKEVTGLPDFLVGKLLPAARGFSLPELREDVRVCAETDYRLKSESSVTEPGALLEELLIRLAMNQRHAAH